MVFFIYDDGIFYRYLEVVIIVGFPSVVGVAVTAANINIPTTRRLRK